MTSDTVIIHGSFGTTVPVADITSGRSWRRFRTSAGRWVTAALGSMRRRAASRDLGERGHAYVTRNAPPFVVVTTNNGFLVFNTDDPARPRRLIMRIAAARFVLNTSAFVSPADAQSRPAPAMQRSTFFIRFTRPLTWIVDRASLRQFSRATPGAFAMSAGCNRFIGGLPWRSLEP
jgi:hypothetical protein